MNVFKKIISIGSILAGVMFLFSSASDIQLGFGLVLLSNGILNWQ